MSTIHNKKPNLEVNNYNRRGIEAKAKALFDAGKITEKQFKSMTDGYVTPLDRAVAKKVWNTANAEISVKGATPERLKLREDAMELMKNVELGVSLQGFTVTGREWIREQNITQGYDGKEEDPMDKVFPGMKFMFPSF